MAWESAKIDLIVAIYEESSEQWWGCWLSPKRRVKHCMFLRSLSGKEL